MTKQKIPFGLRMPDELRRRIHDAAKASGRSLNSEIVERLVNSFVADARPLAAYSDGELLQELINRFGRDAVKIVTKGE